MGQDITERGPGRPEIGGRITTSLGEQLLARVDEHAAAAGTTRAEAVRTLVERGLDAEPTLPVVVWLRGVRQSQQSRDQLVAGCRARGWVVLTDTTRSQTWALARGGCPLLLIWYSGNGATIATVDARWGDGDQPMRLRVRTGGGVPRSTRWDPEAVAPIGSPGMLVVDTDRLLAIADEVIAADRAHRKGPTSSTPEPVDEV